MRVLLIGLAALLAGCATSTEAPRVDGPPDFVEVVYHPGSMFFSVEDGGAGRFVTGENEDYTFPVSHADYVEIRDLLAGYRENGLLCDDPDKAGETPTGYFVWRTDGAETRRPYSGALCYTDSYREASRPVSRAYYAMQAWADERWVPPDPPAVPDPTRMTLTWRSWGRIMEEWTIPRGGQGNWFEQGADIRTFAVSEADFDRLRDVFRDYEGRHFECERVIADLPYGSLTWSQDGHEDQSLKWDLGCVNGDAAEVFERVDRAEAMLKALRDGG